MGYETVFELSVSLDDLGLSTGDSVDILITRAPYLGGDAFEDPIPDSGYLTLFTILTSITTDLSTSSLEPGSNIVISGVITPSRPGVSVDLSFTMPNGTVIQRTTTTSSTGEYSDTYAPSVTGSWSVSSSWDGDSTHKSASSSSKSFTVKKSGCLIATATYGSELSPQVQFLRGFRDNTVYGTFAGSSFMTVFNGFYYSFSPSVASVIAESSPLRDIMKVVLYPLIGILQVSSAVFSVFSFFPELGIIAAGLISSSLIGIVYVLPLALILCLKNKIKVSEKNIRFTGIFWMGSALTLVIAEGLKLPSLMMVSTGAFVLVTLATTTLTSLSFISKYLIH